MSGAMTAVQFLMTVKIKSLWALTVRGVWSTAWLTKRGDGKLPKRLPGSQTFRSSATLLRQHVIILELQWQVRQQLTWVAGVYNFCCQNCYYFHLLQANLPPFLWAAGRYIYIGLELSADIHWQFCRHTAARRLLTDQVSDHSVQW